MQPVTMIFLSLPSFLSSAISKILSMASSQAEAKNPQVLTTATSAPSGERTTLCPACCTVAIICSQLTWFLAQPREMKETL